MNDPIELDWLARWAGFERDRVAMIDDDSGRRWTFGALYEHSCRIARLLASVGVKRGDRVALLSPNDPLAFPLFFGVARLGAILVPLNVRLSPRELDQILQDAQPSVLIAPSALAETISDGPWSRLSLEQLEAAEHDAAPLPFAASFDDPCMILYTSGTTGLPKGALLTHAMLFWNSVSTALRLDLTSADVTVSFLPHFHTGGWHVLNTPLLHRGATLVLQRKFDPAAVLRACGQYGVTVLFGVPTTMDSMARSSSFAGAALSSVRFAVVGGEPMSLELINTWQARGVAIRQGFGMTEVGPNCFSLAAKDSARKIGSIGLPNFYVDARLVRDDGTEAGVDEIGELWLRGPVVTPGYWKNPQATAEAIRDGWFRTGDLLRRDAEGFYFVAGRKKDMFISGGENVYPVEIERVLSTHPQVREVAVIGVKDERWGEVGKAFIAPATLTSAELLAFLEGKLARYKLPRHFEFREALPKTDSGKILKRALVKP